MNLARPLSLRRRRPPPPLPPQSQTREAASRAAPHGARGESAATGDSEPVGERSDGTLTHLEGVRVKLNLNTLTLERALQSMRARVDAIAASGDGHPHGPRLLDEQAFLDAMVAAYTSGIDDSWQTMHQIDFLIARIKEKQDAGVRMLWSAAGKYESLDVRLEALRRQSNAEKRHPISLIKTKAS